MDAILAGRTAVLLETNYHMGLPTTDLAFAFEADQLTGYSDGNTVTSLVDSSGFERHFAAETGGVYRPSGGPAGLPCIEFTAGSAQWYSRAAFLSGGTSAQAFAVLKLKNDPPAETAQTGLWWFGSESNETHYPYINGVTFDSFGTTGRKTTVNPTPSLIDWHAYAARSAADDWASSLNAVQLYATATNTVGWTTTFRIGRSSGTSHLDGYLAALLIVSPAPDAALADAYWGYIAEKYGVPAFPGALSLAARTATTIRVSWNDASFGSKPASQLQVSAAGANDWANVTGATSTPATVSGLAANSPYDLRVRYTHSTGIVHSNVLMSRTLSPYAGQTPCRFGVANGLGFDDD